MGSAYNRMQEQDFFPHRGVNVSTFQQEEIVASYGDQSSNFMGVGQSSNFAAYGANTPQFATYGDHQQAFAPYREQSSKSGDQRGNQQERRQQHGGRGANRQRMPNNRSRIVRVYTHKLITACLCASDHPHFNALKQHIETARLELPTVFRWLSPFHSFPIRWYCPESIPALAEVGCSCWMVQPPEA